MNVDLCDFFAKVAMDPDLVDRLADMPSQNRLAASKSLADIAGELGLLIPVEDFFPLLNVSPTTRSEQEWATLTSHIDMRGPIDPTDTQALMTRVQVIIERQRIKVFNSKASSG